MSASASDAVVGWRKRAAATALSIATFPKSWFPSILEKTTCPRGSRTSNFLASASAAAAIFAVCLPPAWFDPSRTIFNAGNETDASGRHFPMERRSPRAFRNLDLRKSRKQIPRKSPLPSARRVRLQDEAKALSVVPGVRSRCRGLRSELIFGSGSAAIRHARGRCLPRGAVTEYRFARVTGIGR